MPTGIKTFVLRLLFLFPLSMAGWWALASFQIETLSGLSQLILGWIFPSLNLVFESQWETILIQSRGLDRISAGIVIDPLTLTRGLPVFLSLMLAAPNCQRWGRHIAWGLLLIYAAAALGFSAEATVRVIEGIPSASPGEKIPAAFIQIVAKSIATRVLPIGLWLWTYWSFVKGGEFKAESRANG